MQPSELEQVARHLLHERPLQTSAEIRALQQAIPMEPGIYAWFFASTLGLPVHDELPCRDGMVFLYTGIATRLRKRLLNHCNNSSGSSSLRRSIGCLLMNELGLQARTTGVRRKLAFERQGELALSEWIVANARVAWIPFTEPGILESWIIQHYRPPLNIQENAGETQAHLMQLRADARGV